jgi:competence protein ComEC
VDAGGEDSADDVVGYLIRSGVDRIDLLVITHPHEDHVGGLPRVLEEFGVSQILDAGYPHGSPAYREALCSIEARKIDYRLAADWRTLYISKQVGFEVLWPPEDYSPSEEGLNDGSLVLRVRYGGVSLLLAGDIEAEAEARLLAAHLDLKSTVLKVAHHGSADGTSNEFLQLVQPEYAVVSVGMDNPYGHPAGAVLRRLRAVGAEVYRTDRHGTVVFLTDGEKVEVKSER